MAASFVFALEHYREMENAIWNVGSESQNLTKRQLCGLIKEELPDLKVNDQAVGTDPDARNYEVSYRKIREAGFIPETEIRQGIQELVKAFRHFPG